MLGHGRRFSLTGRSTGLRFMTYTVHDATLHVLRRLNEIVQRWDNSTPTIDEPNQLLAEALDSMALVEFLAVLAEDCGVPISAIEECVGRQFGTVAEMAARL